MKKALLVLSNGIALEGVSIGADGTTVGELVFNTSMTGYQEILTDPSYCHQVVTLTCPQIGNVGINTEDNEASKCWCAGLVIRQQAKLASNWRSQSGLEAFLKEKNIVAISEIDTRYLTHILRKQGALSVCISTELSVQQALEQAQAFKGLEHQDLARIVSCSEKYLWTESRGVWADESMAEQSPYHVVAYDFGIKQNILRLLVEVGFKVTVVNAKTSAESVLALEPDGIFLSNGPGDPSACHYAIESVRTFLDKNVPLFGICLGFQILALALGAKTQKMKFGHHGANHPVIDEQTKQIFITSQNHGFMVDEQSLTEDVCVSHRSLFDNSIQGIAVENAFGFQGHPEASPGPHDLMPLFKQFRDMVHSKAL